MAFRVNRHSHRRVNIASVVEDGRRIDAEGQRNSHKRRRNGENFVDFVPIVSLLRQEVLDLGDKTVNRVAKLISIGLRLLFKRFLWVSATLEGQFECLKDLIRV